MYSFSWNLIGNFNWSLQSICLLAYRTSGEQLQLVALEPDLPKSTSGIVESEGSCAGGFEYSLTVGRLNSFCNKEWRYCRRGHRLVVQKKSTAVACGGARTARSLSESWELRLEICCGHRDKVLRATNTNQISKQSHCKNCAHIWTEHCGKKVFLWCRVLEGDEWGLVVFVH